MYPSYFSCNSVFTMLDPLFLNLTQFAFICICSYRQKSLRTHTAGSSCNRKKRTVHVLLKYSTMHSTISLYIQLLLKYPQRTTKLCFTFSYSHNTTTSELRNEVAGPCVFACMFVACFASFFFHFADCSRCIHNLQHRKSQDCSKIAARCSLLDARCSMLAARCWHRIP